MRICGRPVKSSELFMFAFVYLVANYAVIKIQQKWYSPHQQVSTVQRENPLDFLKAGKNPDDRDHLEVVYDTSQMRPGDLPEPAPLQQPQMVHGGLAGVDELSLATEHPLDVGPHEWHFQSDESKQKTESVDDHSDYGNDNIDSEFGEYKDFDEEKHNNAKLKTILFWNTFFTATDFRFGFGHQAFLEAKCPVHTCRTTNDRSQLLNADAVVFHGPRIDAFPPPQRRPGQIYVYVQQEPHYTMSQEELPAFKNHFNITMTHRTDSDIHIPYGRVVYDEANVRKPIHINPQSRPKSIIWAVSHCSTPSRREWYVKELQKYIDIDIYGSCGDLQCSKDDYLYCFSKFEKEYRFYMALENNHCKDYISEKVYRSLLYKMVPIVFGGGNYTDGTPPHSVIDIANYPHPKDLAKYLNYLSHNDKAFNKYFLWRTTGFELEHQRKTIMGDGFCRLCEILHDPHYHYRDYSDLKNWWVNGMCDPFTIPRWRKKNKW